MHRVLFLPAVFAATDDEGLLAIGSLDKLHLKTIPYGGPILIRQQLRFVVAEHWPRGAHDVGAPPFSNVGEVLLVDHATIQHPDPVHLPVLGLDGLDDLLHSGHIVAIAGEDLVGDRQSLPCHDQANADLFAIGSMVA